MVALREYQSLSVDSLRGSFGRGRKRPVLVAPTGSGKTRIAAAVARLSLAKPRPDGKRSRVMFVAPRRKLVKQTAAAFAKLGLDVSLLMAGSPQRSTSDVIVASMQTLTSRIENGLPDVRLVIIDECHESTMGAVKTLVDAYTAQGVPCIGLTATPARGDGTGLGEVFDDMVCASNVAELTRLGHLVPVKYFAPSEPDLKGVKITAGDYNQKQLGERMTPLIGDVVENWQRIANGQKTVVFTVTVANATALCDAFRAAGVAAEWISGETPDDEQERIFERHASGETLVLCNAQLLSFGWDSPSVTCCVLAKPTKSIANYLQMAGRVLRPADGKTHATIIDHSGVVDRLGFVDDDFGWTLDGRAPAVENRSRKVEKDPKPTTCPCCKALHKPAPKCEYCGWSYPPRAETPEMVAAKLEEIQRGERKAKAKTRKEMTQEERTQIYAELMGYAQAHGKSIGWSYYLFNDIFGAFPSGRKPSPQPCSERTERFVRSAFTAKQAMKRRQSQGVAVCA